MKQTGSILPMRGGCSALCGTYPHVLLRASSPPLPSRQTRKAAAQGQGKHCPTSAPSPAHQQHPEPAAQPRASPAPWGAAGNCTEDHCGTPSPLPGPSVPPHQGALHTPKDSSVLQNHSTPVQGSPPVLTGGERSPFRPINHEFPFYSPPPPPFPFLPSFLLPKEITAARRAPPLPRTSLTKYAALFHPDD